MRPLRTIPPPPSAPSPSSFEQRVYEISNRAIPPAPPLARFNLDFLGGAPSDLVDAIEKATGKPLNAIIPTEDEDVQLPPLKMNDVDAPQLFNALHASSQKMVTVQNGQWSGSYSQFITDYGFTTADSPVSDTSIWYFHANKPTLPPVISNQKVCQFFQLAPYLDRGFTVDDITTAIQTGWKMAGIASPPELNYHKETRLLIAFGEPGELAVIQNVLQALPASALSAAEVGEVKVNIDDLQHDVRDLKAQVKDLNQRISTGK